jgi:hypothetical protein
VRDGLDGKGDSIMKKQRVSITHEDVERALARFRKQGGIITRLPDQVTPQTGVLPAAGTARESLLVESVGLEPAWSGSPFNAPR